MNINILPKLMFALLLLTSQSLYASTTNINTSYSNTKSNSLQLSVDGSQFISANMDAGSVSILNAETGELVAEQALGKDLRRLALDPINNQLLVSDYLADQLYLIDAKSLKLIKTIKTGYRPFGIVYDEYNKQYYVTLFEAKQLITVSTNGEITATTQTADTPRGLALASDGRLFVTHSMTGQVSIYNTRSQSLELNKIIQLADTPVHASRATPQGKPRVLDNIAISPDGTQAWLPHVLWSFSQDFQFQSTVFIFRYLTSRQVKKKKWLINVSNYLNKSTSLRTTTPRVLCPIHMM